MKLTLCELFYACDKDNPLNFKEIRLLAGTNISGFTTVIGDIS